MGLFTAFVLMSVLAAGALWLTYRRLRKRLPPMVDLPRIEPPIIDIGQPLKRQPIDPFSGEPLGDERALVTLEDLSGKAWDFRVNRGTELIYRSEGLCPFKETMSALFHEPGESYCLCCPHKFGIVDEVAIAFLYDELFGGYGGSFDNGFADLRVHWSRRGSAYGYEYELADPFAGRRILAGSDDRSEEKDASDAVDEDDPEPVSLPPEPEPQRYVPPDPAYLGFRQREPSDDPDSRDDEESGDR